MGQEDATTESPGGITGDVIDCVVVVVTHNNADDLPDLFSSLTPAAGSTTLRTVVVDNRSTDGTADVAEAAGADCVVRSHANLGYAGGINEGCRAAASFGDRRAILVLNPDLRLGPGAVAAMLDMLDMPGVGAVVPRLTDGDGRTLRSQRREPTLGRAVGDALFGSHLPRRPHWSSEEIRSEWSYHRPVAVDWATGAAIMVGSDVAEAVGDWDETFFMYSEEVDYCRRIRAHGQRILYAPEAVAVHAEGGSGRSDALTALYALNGVRAYAGTHSRAATAAFRLVAAARELARMHKPGHVHAMLVLGLATPPSFPGAPRDRTGAVVTGAPPTPSSVGSVVIPAHDEASVIERCLTSLSRGARGDAPTVVVACNGCTDDTAAIARASHVATEVIELARPSKTAAINAAEELGLSLPRIYLDADVELTARAAHDVIRTLDDGAIAARPPLRYRTEGASWVVRSYYRARSRTPSLLGRLWGAGVYGLSAEGRRRFGPYPDVVGEDLWVDEHFSDEEIVVVDTDPVVVRVPRTARALLRTLRRTQRGRMEHHSSTTDGGRADLQTTPTGTFRAVVGTARTGWLAAADAAVYVLVAVWSRVLARLARPGTTWERDDTSRTAEHTGLPPEGTGS